MTAAVEHESPVGKLGIVVHGGGGKGETACFRSFYDGKSFAKRLYAVQHPLDTDAADCNAAGITSDAV